MVTYILLALGGLSLIFFLLFRKKEGGVLPLSLKVLTSLLFVATAIASVIGNYNLTGTASFNKLMFSGLIIMGLVCDVVGDFALDLKVTYLETNVRHSDLYTFMGMGAFGVGHILFIIAIGIYFGFSPWSVLIAFGLGTCVFCAGKFLMKLDFGKFIVPVAVYCFLLSFFIVVSVTAGLIASFGTTVTLLICGSSLFLCSELILSLNYFDGNESRFIIVLDHTLYFAAQFLIALSLYYTGVTL